MGLVVVPVSFREAAAFIAQHHRHHAAPRGMKFAVGVRDATGLVGVATVGRPVARCLDDGVTLEVTRSCTVGTANANSMLYGAAWRIARGMGYRRVVTYTQAGESGASLRAAGFVLAEHLRRRPGWDAPGRRRMSHGVDDVARARWEISRAAAVGQGRRGNGVERDGMSGIPCAAAVLSGTAATGGPGADRSRADRDVRPRHSSQEGGHVPEHPVLHSCAENDSGTEGGTWQVELVACLSRLAEVIEQSTAGRERDPDALLTAEDLGAVLNLSPRTLKDQAAAGVLPHHRFGKHYRFSRSDITEILRRTQQSPKPVTGRLHVA